MGSYFSRQNAGVEEVSIGVNHAYKYPPKQGFYFSNYFIMGGEKFETARPEMYLFGENMDLNFLGSRPAPFPYSAPSPSEPSKTLKAMINIRKESLRFVKVPEETHSLKDSEPVDRGGDHKHVSSPSTNAGPTSHSPSFNIEFTFDCDVRCAITIKYFCSEECTSQGLVYIPRDPAMNSETYHYKRGANQQFSQSCHVFSPSMYQESDLLYSFEREICPVVVHCVAEEGEEPRQSQATIAVVERHSDGYVLKALKQKLFVHGLCYLLQEIYGIENKNSEVLKNSDDDEGEENGAECVICMSDLRDTLILPCRHLCLCNCCADNLRYQANNCPICRAPFLALLQIKALQKTSNSSLWVSNQHDTASDVPPGYEAVSLIEALNGPSVAPPVQPSAPSNCELYVRLPQTPVPTLGDARRAAADRSVRLRNNGGNLEDSTTQTDGTTIDHSSSATKVVSVLDTDDTDEEQWKPEGRVQTAPSGARLRSDLNSPTMSESPGKKSKRSGKRGVRRSDRGAVVKEDGDAVTIDIDRIKEAREMFLESAASPTGTHSLGSPDHSSERTPPAKRMPRSEPCLAESKKANSQHDELDPDSDGDDILCIDRTNDRVTMTNTQLQDNHEQKYFVPQSPYMSPKEYDEEAATFCADPSEVYYSSGTEVIPVSSLRREDEASPPTHPYVAANDSEGKSLELRQQGTPPLHDSITSHSRISEPVIRNHPLSGTERQASYSTVSTARSVPSESVTVPSIAMEMPSMPGTPLSQASTVSVVSNLSDASANSSQALLQPAGCKPPTVV